MKGAKKNAVAGVKKQNGIGWTTGKARAHSEEVLS